jgi:hypothetical protein
MQIVTAEHRRTGILEFCSQPMPAHQTEKLVDFLRRCTKLRIAVEAVGPPAAPDTSTSRASVGGQHAG